MWLHTSITAPMNKLYHTQAAFLPTTFQSSDCRPATDKLLTVRILPHNSKQNVLDRRTFGHLPFSQAILIVYKLALMTR